MNLRIIFYTMIATALITSCDFEIVEPSENPLKSDIGGKVTEGNSSVLTGSEFTYFNALSRSSHSYEILADDLPFLSLEEEVITMNWVSLIVENNSVNMGRFLLFDLLSFERGQRYFTSNLNGEVLIQDDGVTSFYQQRYQSLFINFDIFDPIHVRGQILLNYSVNGERLQDIIDIDLRDPQARLLQGFAN